MLALAVAQGQVVLDRPDESEVLSVTCARCRGRDEDCERCDGSGEEDVTVQEIRQAAERRDVRTAISAYSAWRSNGILPAAGAFLDQSAGFHDVTRFLDGEIARNRASEQNARAARARGTRGR